jgi:hypothetical protein
MCKVKIAEVVGYPVRIQASLLFVVPVQAGPLHILPGSVIITRVHVSNLWKNINGIQYVLASDNSPGKDWAREIDIAQKVVTVTDIRIS